MDLARIREIVNITLPIPESQYSWTMTKLNGTDYRININSSVSLNEMTLKLTFLKPDLVIDS